MGNQCTCNCDREEEVLYNLGRDHKTGKPAKRAHLLNVQKEKDQETYAINFNSNNARPRTSLGNDGTMEAVVDQDVSKSDILYSTGPWSLESSDIAHTIVNMSGHNTNLRF